MSLLIGQAYTLLIIESTINKNKAPLAKHNNNRVQPFKQIIYYIYFKHSNWFQHPIRIIFGVLNCSMRS